MNHTASTPPSRRLPTLGLEYYSVIMGTGIVGVLLPTISSSLTTIGRIIVIANAIGLLILASITVIAFARDRLRLRQLLDNPARAMFLGCVPMAMSSVSNGVDKLEPNLLGSHAATTEGLGVWLGLTLVMTLVSVLYVPYRLFAHHLATLEDMNATWLLPIVPAEVTTFQLALVAPSFNHALAIDAVWSGYLLWAFSVPLALSLIALITLRLVTHHLPAPHLATSTWLILGPLGTGAAAIAALGHDLTVLSPSPLSATLAGAGVVGALTLAGYGLWWLLVAGVLSLEYLRRGTYPFTIGWWGFTFPLGVLTTGVGEIALATHVTPIHDLAVGLAVLLVALWSMVAVRTVHAAIADRRCPVAEFALVD